MNKILVAILMVMSAGPASAAVLTDAFGQGRAHFSLLGGNGYAFDNDYLIIGVSTSYYLLDGLAVGLSVENWSGADPGIFKYAPIVQYVFRNKSSMRPYIGGFFRHTEIKSLPDIESYGGRAGVYFASGPNYYVSAGIVYESYIDCQQTIYSTCSDTYPDVGFTIGF